MYTPIPPTIKYLDDESADELYRKMDPKNQDWCLLNQCSGPGALINLWLNTCNNTITRIVPSRPPTLKDIKSLLSQCICGKTDDSKYGTHRLAIMNAWKTCSDCYVTGFPGNPWTSFNETVFIKACACEEPGPLDALLNVFNPNFQCTKQGATRGELGEAPLPPGYAIARAAAAAAAADALNGGGRPPANPSATRPTLPIASTNTISAPTSTSTTTVVPEVGEGGIPAGNLRASSVNRNRWGFVKRWLGYVE
ncbi:hypothetical protein HDV05_007492 [Chytridiales sp. JEL 0842]|nr:hypothetical protein HDV05_007492 [Chytridiales sp. JEL 0842]